MMLNEELITIARELLTKEDRIILADRLNVHISSIYPILRGIRKVNKSQYDMLQKYIVECKKERS
jgi:hypothetical protein